MRKCRRCAACFALWAKNDGSLLSGDLRHPAKCRRRFAAGRALTLSWESNLRVLQLGSCVSALAEPVAPRASCRRLETAHCNSAVLLRHWRSQWHLNPRQSRGLTSIRRGRGAESLAPRSKRAASCRRRRDMAHAAAMLTSSHAAGSGTLVATCPAGTTVNEKASTKNDIWNTCGLGSGL